MLKDTCLISFSGTSLHRDYQRELHRLYGNNFGENIEYTDYDIKQTDFYKENMQMFQYKKYFGYFLWKPYIILDALKKTPLKYVLYCDSNLRFINFVAFENSYKGLINKQDSFFVRHEHFLNREWTKRDTFILMGADEKRYWNANQVWTPLMGFGRSKQTERILIEYMAACKIPKAILETPSEWASELEGFKEHRWEQSVMSILVEKFQRKGIPDTQVINWVTKHYSKELMEMKEEVNKDPLAKNEQREP